MVKISLPFISMTAHMTKPGFQAPWLLLLVAGLLLCGCRTQVTLVNYGDIQKRALRAIGAKYPALNPDDLRLESIKSEMSSGGAEVIEVDFEQPRASLYVGDPNRNGEKRLVDMPTFIVRMTNSGLVLEVGKGMSDAFR
jgi:hypothetical protein